jgi:hypothetical protein
MAVSETASPASRAAGSGAPNSKEGIDGSEAYEGTIRHALPARSGKRFLCEEPYPTTSALRSTQRQSPNLGLLSKEASLTLRMYGENNSQRGECKEKSYEEGQVLVDCEADGFAEPRRSHSAAGALKAATSDRTAA